MTETRDPRAPALEILSPAKDGLVRARVWAQTGSGEKRRYIGSGEANLPSKKHCTIEQLVSLAGGRRALVEAFTRDLLIRIRARIRVENLPSASTGSTRIEY